MKNTKLKVHDYIEANICVLPLSGKKAICRGNIFEYEYDNDDPENSFIGGTFTYKDRKINRYLRQSDVIKVL